MTRTTFWLDFTIADAFGTSAIQDTYNRAFDEWKSDHEYLTALVITLNHKLWQHWEAGKQEYAILYDTLWKQAHQYALDNLTGDELKYYITETD